MHNIDVQHQAVFNNFNIALNIASGAFLKDIATTKLWEEINIAEETNAIISNITDETYSEECSVSANDNLENFKVSLVSELSKLLHKTKSQRAKEYILELIAIVSLLFSIYSHSTSLKQEDIAGIVKNELLLNDEFLITEIEKTINICINKTRIARINTKLQYADKKRAQIIGIVKQGQQVTVIEIRHQYLLVSYIDQETKEPKSGFVMKKYFR